MQGVFKINQTVLYSSTHVLNNLIKTVDFFQGLLKDPFLWEILNLGKYGKYKPSVLTTSFQYLSAHDQFYSI